MPLPETSKCCNASFHIDKLPSGYPPNTKPTDPRVPEETWWMKYAEGNWVGLSSVPTILAEQRRRTLSEITQFVELVAENAFLEGMRMQVQTILNHLESLKK